MGVDWKFKKEDVWIGAYWNVLEVPGPWIGEDFKAYERHKRVDLWVCLVPCFPIHFWWTKKVGISKMAEG